MYNTAGYSESSCIYADKTIQKLGEKYYIIINILDL